jgi:hypothetical protein
LFKRESRATLAVQHVSYLTIPSPMPSQKTISKAPSRQRADGRRQLLIYLAPEVIKDVKKVAVDDDTTASSITEEALRDWLKRRSENGQGGQ